MQYADSVALWHVGFPQIRDQTHVYCITRWILNHQTPREVPLIDSFSNIYHLTNPGKLWELLTGIYHTTNALIIPSTVLNFYLTEFSWCNFYKIILDHCT